MNIRRQIQLLRVLCGAVVLAACVGVFTTGAWAFNTQTFRTPTETLEMGTFSVCVANAQPDENGTYHFEMGTKSVTLQAEGNMPSLVLPRWTPEGEQVRLYYLALDPTTAENSTLVIPISTGKPLALTLAPVLERPEEVEEIPVGGIVVEAPPAQVEPTNEATSAQTSGDETGETENTSTVNIVSGTATTTSTDESTSEVVEPQEPATVEENTTVEEETVVESSEDNEVGTQSEVESDGESSLQMPTGESEEPLILESEATSGEPLA